MVCGHLFFGSKIMMSAQLLSVLIRLSDSCGDETWTKGFTHTAVFSVASSLEKNTFVFPLVNCLKETPADRFARHFRACPDVKVSVIALRAVAITHQEPPNPWMWSDDLWPPCAVTLGTVQLTLPATPSPGGIETHTFMIHSNHQMIPYNVRQGNFPLNLFFFLLMRAQCKASEHLSWKQSILGLPASAPPENLIQ